MQVCVYWVFICWSLLASASLVAAAANDNTAISAKATTPHVTATLVSSEDAVVAGSTITVALQQQIIDHWHTYWKNPGDSGTPVTLDWVLPEGVTASEIHWPAPRRFSLGPVTNYGFSGTVLFPVDIQVPATYPTDQTLKLELQAQWLVCFEECIPEEVVLALEIPVLPAASTHTPAATAYASDIQASKTQVKAWPFAPPTLGTQPLQLRLPNAATSLHTSSLQQLYFYSSIWGQLQHHAEQTWQVDGADLLVNLTLGDLGLQQPLQGVLRLDYQDGSGQAFAIDLSAPAAPLETPETLESSADLSILAAVLLALGGGLLLNLMPCVFPVLSIKALALVQHADEPAKQQRLHGIVYTLGVVSSFVALALLIYGFKQLGTDVGWGFQFQSPSFVLLMALLLWLVGLNLSGVFELSSRLNGIGQQLTEGNHLSASFFTGVLATVVATPCTAPLMAAALGFALTQPLPILLLVFVALGLGLALPILLLSYLPRLQRLLPKPGAWMETFRQLLAFPVYGAVIWLAWVFTLQQGASGLLWLLVNTLTLAFAAWWYQRSRFASTRAAWLGFWLPLVLVLLVLGTTLRQLQSAAANADTGTKPSANATYETYSDQRLAELLAAQQPVFVNFTAAWCISCLANEKVALSTTQVQQHFATQGITYLKADWTLQDEHIRQTLARHGRSGVPLYLFYPAGQTTPRQLPQLLTADLVVEHTSVPAQASAPTQSIRSPR